MIIALPIGPVGALGIQRTAVKSMASGVISGLGATVADIVFGLVSLLGMSFISGLLLENEAIFRVVGGLILFYFGISVVLSDPKRAVNNSSSSLLADFVSAFLLTLSNPMVILSFVAVYAVLGIVGPSLDAKEITIFIAGFFIGSMGLWVLVSYIVHVMKKGLDEKGIGWINRGAGLLIIGCGVYAFLSLLI